MKIEMKMTVKIDIEKPNPSMHASKRVHIHARDVAGLGKESVGRDGAGRARGWREGQERRGSEAGRATVSRTCLEVEHAGLGGRLEVVALGDLEEGCLVGEGERQSYMCVFGLLGKRGGGGGAGADAP